MWTLTADSGLWQDQSDSIWSLWQDQGAYMCGFWQLTVSSDKASVIACGATDKITATKLTADREFWHGSAIEQKGSAKQPITSAEYKSVRKPHANLPGTPVALTSASQYFQMLPLAPLELSKVLSDSTRAFSSAPESTCSYGGAFRMLWDLTIRIVKFWSSWDLCAGPQETLRGAETFGADLGETSRAAESSARALLVTRVTTS